MPSRADLAPAPLQGFVNDQVSTGIRWHARLDDQQEHLATHGQRRPACAGEHLMKETPVGRLGPVRLQQRFGVSAPAGNRFTRSGVSSTWVRSTMAGRPSERCEWDREGAGTSSWTKSWLWSASLFPHESFMPGFFQKMDGVKLRESPIKSRSLVEDVSERIEITCSPLFGTSKGGQLVSILCITRAWQRWSHGSSQSWLSKGKSGREALFCIPRVGESAADPGSISRRRDGRPGRYSPTCHLSALFRGRWNILG
jgi:hypothetical protein